MEQNRKVVVIMTDTQRWDMVSSYADTGLSTPNIDRLAKNGVRFERAYTTQPVCQPARAGIFTGMYPSSSGSWTNSTSIGTTVRTVGQRLQDKGIHTAYVGKWHLDGGDYFGLGVCPPGWDAAYWFDMRNYLEELTEEERLLSRKPESMLSHPISREFTYAGRCTDRAVRFLKNHSGEDFFLTVAYDEPHHPFLCPEGYWRPFENYAFPKSPTIWDTLENKPDYQKVWAGERLGRDKETLERKHPFYFGCNAFADSEIGRVLDAVEAYAPGALVIYTSDHGDFLDAHSLAGKGPAAYDDIARIPLLMAGPGLPAGKVDKAPVSHINIAPTIFDVMGFQQPKVFHGKSLVPQLEGSREQVNDTVFVEFGRYEVDHDGFGGMQLMRSAFDGRFKLSVHLLSSDELYDMENDPDELVNLIDREEYTTVRNRLHDSILENMNNTRDPFRGYYWQRRPWRADAPEADWEYTHMTRQREDEEYEPRQLDYDTGLPMVEAVRRKF